MVKSEISQNVREAMQPVNQSNNKNPFSKDGSIHYKRITDAFENTVKIQVKKRCTSVTQ